MDSLVQPCYSQLLPVCLCLPSKFSQGHTVTLSASTFQVSQGYTVTLHLPNGGVKCQSRIQHTKDTCLKPTPSSASILELPDRHRNYRKQICLEMLSTNTNKRTLEGHVETIDRYLVKLKILRKLESSHATLRNEKILETPLGKNSNIWWLRYKRNLTNGKMRNRQPRKSENCWDKQK